MAPPMVFEQLDQLRRAGPMDLGRTEWSTVDSPAVEEFCAATGTPAPVAGEPVPPLLLLSLTNRFLPELVQVPAASSGINYGAERVRFQAPAHPGDRIRARASLMDVTEVAGGLQTRIQVRVEVEGTDQPCCVVESLSRWLS